MALDLTPVLDLEPVEEQPTPTGPPEVSTLPEQSVQLGGGRPAPGKGAFGPRSMWQNVTTPVVNYPPEAIAQQLRFNPSQPAIGMALAALPPKLREDIIKGVSEGVAQNVVDPFLSPLGAGTMLAGGAIPKVAQKAMQIGFGVLGGMGVPGTLKRLAQAKTPGEASKELIGLGAEAGMAVGGVKGVTDILPRSRAALSQVKPTTERPENATIPERITEAIPVEVPPGSRGEVGERAPAKEEAPIPQEAQAPNAPEGQARNVLEAAAPPPVRPEGEPTRVAAAAATTEPSGPGEAVTAAPPAASVSEATTSQGVKQAPPPLPPQAEPQTAPEGGATKGAEAAAGSRGIAASVRSKWTSATDLNLGSEAGFISMAPLKAAFDKVAPWVKSAVNAVMEAGIENIRLAPTSDYRRSILNWSAKMQRSFGEAASAQSDIRKQVPNRTRREGITNWIQANGDKNVLQQRLQATTDPKLRAGYEAALSLTPDEITVANDVKNAYDTLGQRGQNYDVLNSFKDNYVTQIWDLKKGPTGGAGSRRLREKFRFSKASTFPTFFDGEQASFTPKTKDISELLPVYLHEMNSVIAARQLVEQMSKGRASDGRPLLAPRGVGAAVDNAKGKATLVMPDVSKVNTSDYRVIENQPALHDWRWVTKDAAGNPVFLKSDLAVHPEAADYLKNVLGKSAIREWYESKTSAAAAIPKALVKGLDIAQSETKRTMLGLLTPFHQVQEGTHAIGHRVNPFFNNPTIDLVNNPAQMDAARHGLMLLPDRISQQQFMEGFKQSGLVSKIPVIGAIADHYSNYLFHQYIPGIKFKTYEAIYSRNTKVYERELANRTVTPEDVKILSAEQANAAYGHLNYADLGRNPTILHLMRLGLLAPDFLEARMRFSGQAIKGLTGAKVGREQLIALGALAAAQATLAYISAKLTGGEWDIKDPFSFHLGNKKFTMRSVPEDSYRLIQDTRAFVYARLNPIIGRGLIQYLSGVDWRGHKVSAGTTTKELLEQPVPLSLRPLFGIGNTQLGTWEELASSAGLKISRYSASSEVHKLAQQWALNSADPKIRDVAEQQQESTFAQPYAALKDALHRNDLSRARSEYYKLRSRGRDPRSITRVMLPREFTSKEHEGAFIDSLTPDQKQLYYKAKDEQFQTWQRFTEMLQNQ